MDTFQIENPFIVAEGNGFSRITMTREYLGTQSSVLASLASSVLTMNLNVGKIRAHPYPVHLAMRAGETIAFTRVEELKFTTFYRPVEQNRCVPCWAQAQSADFSASFIWKPGIPIWFVCVFLPPDTTKIGMESLPAGMLKQGFLLAVNPQLAGAWRLPISNLYPDAKICWAVGGAPYYGPLPKEGTLCERLGKCLNYLNESRWNGHLGEHHNPDDTNAILNFTLEGETIPPHKNWTNHCKRVSSAYFNDLPLQQLTMANL